MLQTLYISTNSLRSLQGIGQFCSLRCLSAVANKLASLAILDELHHSCPHLAHLNAASNPFCMLPLYRCVTGV